MRWLGEASLNRPSTLKSFADGSLVNPCASAPFGERQSFTFPFNALIIASVKLLNGLSGPPAIIRGVITIVVDAINGMAHGWTRSHVSVEHGERVTPTLTDGNASPSVAMEVLSGWARASLDHVSPYMVFGGIPQAVRRFRFQNLNLDAAARMRAWQVCSGNQLLVAAITSAPIARMSRALFITFQGQDSETAVSVAGREWRENHGSDFTLLHPVTA